MVPPIKSADERSGESDPDSSRELVIIREVYDSDSPHEKFECELETALANATETIVIEPARLGDETSRWISVGNCIHKTSVLSGLTGIMFALAYPDKPLIYFPISCLSLVSTSVYVLSWQGDPCCKYQVESNPANLPRLRGLNSSSPVVLVRHDDSRRKILQSIVTLSSIFFSSVNLYYNHR